MAEVCKRGSFDCFKALNSKRQARVILVSGARMFKAAGVLFLVITGGMAVLARSEEYRVNWTVDGIREYGE